MRRRARPRCARRSEEIGLGSRVRDRDRLSARSRGADRFSRDTGGGLRAPGFRAAARSARGRGYLRGAARVMRSTRPTTACACAARDSPVRKSRSATFPSVSTISGARPRACCSPSTGMCTRRPAVSAAEGRDRATLALMARLRDPERRLPVGPAADLRNDRALHHRGGLRGRRCDRARRSCASAR